MIRRLGPGDRDGRHSGANGNYVQEHDWYTVNPRFQRQLISAQRADASSDGLSSVQFSVPRFRAVRIAETYNTNIHVIP